MSDTRLVLNVTIAFAALAACSLEPTVSDTGYVGTWRRGNERVISVINIARDGERYLFKWTLDSADERWNVRCDWEGHCEEVVDDRKVADYTFRTWIDERTGHLMLECRGSGEAFREMEEHYIDELVVDEGGLKMKAYTLERRGRKVERDRAPYRTYEKVADATGR